MIVRQFINWIRTAPAGERAEATRSLARAWLISDLTEADRAADTADVVRQALSALVREAESELETGSRGRPLPPVL